MSCAGAISSTPQACTACYRICSICPNLDISITPWCWMTAARNLPRAVARRRCASCVNRARARERCGVAWVLAESAFGRSRPRADENPIAEVYIRPQSGQAAIGVYEHFITARLATGILKTSGFSADARDPQSVHDLEIERPREIDQTAPSLKLGLRQEAHADFTAVIVAVLDIEGDHVVTLNEASGKSVVRDFDRRQKLGILMQIELAIIQMQEGRVETFGMKFLIKDKGSAVNFRRGRRRGQP